MEPEHETNWRGFEPVGYTLNFYELKSAAITEIFPNNKNNSELNIRDLVFSIGNELIEVTNYHDELVLNTTSGTRKFVSHTFILDLLEILLNLKISGIDGLNCIWYIYDHDHVLDDPHESYSFFLVFEKKIVEGTYSLQQYHGNGFKYEFFDPTIDRENQIWSNETAYKEAINRYWYKKFYTETFTGKIMTLRTDNPIMFYHPNHPADDPSTTPKDNIFSEQLSIEIAYLTNIIESKLQKIQISIYALIIIYIIGIIFIIM